MPAISRLFPETSVYSPLLLARYCHMQSRKVGLKCAGVEGVGLVRTPNVCTMNNINIKILGMEEPKRHKNKKASMQQNRG